MIRICAILLVLAAPESATELRLEHVLAQKFPAAAELQVRAELAALRRELAGSDVYLAERPTYDFWLGARRGDDSAGQTQQDADLEIEGEWPLLAERSQRDLFARQLQEHAALLEEGAAAAARRDVWLAYLDVWLADRRLALLNDEVTLLERWQDRLHQVVEAGGAAAFELELIGLETETMLFQRQAVAAQHLEAWSALAALVPLPATPARLAEPPPLAAPPPALPPEEALALRATAARYEIAVARASFERALATSRFSLLGSAAREGEENVLRFGLSLRPVSVQQRQAEVGAATGALAALAREIEIERALLLGRFQVARQLHVALAPTEAESFEARAAKVVAAIELRLIEGKERPAEALALRRQIFSLRDARLETSWRRFRQEAEIVYLTEKESR